MEELSNSTYRKFIESIELDDFEVLTESGFKGITHVHKTVPYEVFEVTLSNGDSIKCADTHIFITNKFEQVYAKDSLNSVLLTDSGDATVIKVESLDYDDYMYDITVDSHNHTYYTNGILSHNTTTATCLLLHYAIFNNAKRIYVLANKESASIEILERIQLAYEALPKWLQRGVKEWNKKSVTFENKSKIVAAATSSSSIRGKSCVTGDTLLSILNEHACINIQISDLENTEYHSKIASLKVLTKDGYKSFKGILNQGLSEKLLKITFDDNTYLKCTHDHKILFDDFFLDAETLEIGMHISNKIITNIEIISNEVVYDLFQVEGGHYLTNGVTSHNCSFLYIDECVAPDTYITIKDRLTQKIEKITIGELNDRLLQEQSIL